jgi:hypothetical protein
VPPAITERFCRGAGGELEPLTSGSTRPVAQVVTHAGICKVERYAFSINAVNNKAGLPGSKRTTPAPGIELRPSSRVPGRPGTLPQPRSLSPVPLQCPLLEAEHEQY